MKNPFGPGGRREHLVCFSPAHKQDPVRPDRATVEERSRGAELAGTTDADMQKTHTHTRAKRRVRSVALA